MLCVGVNTPSSFPTRPRRFTHVPTNFSYVPTYCHLAQVVRSVEHQTWWCSDVLPQHHPQLVVALVEQLLQNTEREFVQRLDSALTDTLPVPMPAKWSKPPAS